MFSKFALITFTALTMFQTADAEIKMSGPIEFGLFPTTQVTTKKKHALPDCNDPKAAEQAKQGYCLGAVLPEEIEGISLDGEWIQEDFIIRIIKRNPSLVGLAEFLEICRPRGGTLSPDELSCQYTIWF